MFNLKDFNDNYNTVLAANNSYPLYNVQALKTVMSINVDDFTGILHISHTEEQQSYIFIYDSKATSKTDKNTESSQEQRAKNHQYKHFILAQDCIDRESLFIGPCEILIEQQDDKITLSYDNSDPDNQYNVIIKLMSSSAYEHVYKIQISALQPAPVLSTTHADDKSKE